MSALASNEQIAVIGAGTMGAGIAQVAAAAGHPVILLDIAEGAAKKGLDGLVQGLQKLVDKGKKKQTDVNDLLDRITPAQSLEKISDCRLIVEAIVENLAVKQSVIADIEKVSCIDAIIASNTSSLSISALAAKAQRPENIVGMHFFNPAVILKLVEVVSGLQTSEAVANTVFDTALAWGKKPVHAKSTPGFIVNRVARPFYAEALRSVSEQFAPVETIDQLMRGCGGFKMGPLELTDLIGQDVNCAVTESVYQAFYQDKRFMPSVLQAEMVSAGLLGCKSGRGFYNYPNRSQEELQQQTNIEKQSSIGKDHVTTSGDIVPLTGLEDCLLAHGYPATHSSKTVFKIEAGSAVIMVSDGRTASQRAIADNIKNLVLLDYAKDYSATTHVAITTATNSSQQAITDAQSFFQSLGKQVHVVKDVPGMLVLRTVCMLINEAHDAVNQGVCSAADVDIAMQTGVAYPMGPMAWSDLIGVSKVANTLRCIQTAYGEERYRVSPLLSQRALEQ